MIRILLFLISLLSILLFSGCRGYDSDYLTVCTFNIEWLGDGIDDRLPRDTEDYKKIAGLIEQSGADIIALQEVENKKALEELTLFLEDYTFYISEKGGNQKTAYLVKNTVHVKYLDEYEPINTGNDNLRTGLVLKASISDFDFIMMNIHLKANSRYDSTHSQKKRSLDIRNRQFKIISHWADSVIDAGDDKDLIIIGDYNDAPGRDGNAMSPLTDNKNLILVTSDMKSCKNPLWYAIDHVTVSKQAYERYISNSNRAINLESIFREDELDKISDHCPLLVQFSIN